MASDVHRIPPLHNEYLREELMHERDSSSYSQSESRPYFNGRASIIKKMDNI